MNTFLYVLVGWIIVLYLVNKVREKYSKPKTVNILVKRNGVYQEVEAVVMPRSHNSDVGTGKTGNEAAPQWLNKEDDISELEYYSGGSLLKAARDFEAQQMEQNSSHTISVHDWELIVKPFTFRFNKVGCEELINDNGKRNHHYLPFR